MKDQTNQSKFSYGKLYGGCIVIILAVMVFSFNFEEKNAIRVSYDPAPTVHYYKNTSSSTNGAFRQLPTKVCHFQITPTVANGGSLDISGFGLTMIQDVQVTVVRNVSTANDVPTVALKSISTTAITYNITQGNNAVVAILGINVLSGTPNVFVPTPTDCTLFFQVTGY